MFAMEPRKVVVGISPHQSSDAVLEYAAVEAARRECGVHLVVVEHPVWDSGTHQPDVEVVDEELRRGDSVLLSRAEALVRQWLPEPLTITTEITHGSVGRALREISRHSEMVVLQHHRMGRPFHLPSKSVTNAVASRADAPVVAVPDDWHEAELAHDVVVAGVESAAESWAVAEAALAAASTTGGEVRLLHAWSWYDDEEEQDPEILVSSRGSRSRLVEERLQHDFAPLAARYPDVDCEVVVVYGQAEYVLVTTSAKARLLVLGRHRRQLPVGSHLGPVTGTVLGYAHCPVMVVDPRTGETHEQTTAPVVTSA